MAKHSDMVTATARHYMYSKISFFQGWKEKVYPVSTPQRPPPFRGWLEKCKSLPNQLDFVNYVINSHSFLLLQKAIYISNGVSVREKWIPLEPSLRRNLFWGLPCNVLTGKTPPVITFASCGFLRNSNRSGMRSWARSRYRGSGGTLEHQQTPGLCQLLLPCTQAWHFYYSWCETLAEYGSSENHSLTTESCKYCWRQPLPTLVFGEFS